MKVSTFMSTLDFIKREVEIIPNVRVEPVVDIKTDSVIQKKKEDTDLEGNSDKTGLFTKELISKWKKELKISGSIGLAGQKDKITFSSLAYLIENAVKK